MSLEQQVFSSLDSAVANDYDLREWSAEEIANDLHEYDADLESVSPAELLPHVQAWKEARK